MTVEENQRSFRENENNQKFPVGMRVLAVDDDPTCLKLLENLLRKCQYNVTTTGQAITALKLLRENREKFDLVISDVHMPDMDGFKLLELVGLEMDLPVIMLSANSDTRAVMKGITHGACDYLLKPVRIEELKNIWQHVIRRRKIDSKDYNHSGHGDDNETLRHGADESGHGTVTVGATDQKTNRKRKDQNEDDEDDYDENGHEHDDPSAQKKPRVVWSVELHQKFVAAVNQLGIDKAVPKRILDLMNVERLTRENVASHLQKYRLYLKRISCVANQQGNLAAALGGRDSFVPLASLDGFGDFHALPSFPLGAVGRLNSLTAMGMRSISPSGMPQLVHESNSGNSINYLGKFHRFGLSGDQQGNLLHGLPTSLELDQLQQKQSVSYLGEFSGSVDESSMFPISQNRLTGANSLNGTGVSTSYSSCSFLGAPNNPLVAVTQQQQAQGRGLGNQSPVTIAALEHEFFDVNAGISSHLPEYDRCNTTWQNAVPLAGYSAKPLAVGVPLNRGDLSSTSLTDNVMLKDTSIECNPFDISSNSLITEPSHDPLIGGVSNRQGASLVDANARRVAGVIDESSKFSMLGSLGNTRVGHSINYGHNQDYAHGSNTLMGSPINSMVVNHGITSPMSQNPEQNNGVCSGKMNVTSRGQLNSGLPIFMQQPGNEKSVMENQMKMREEYLLGNVKSQGGFSPNSCNSFDNLIDTTTKQEQDEETFMEGDIGCDVYPIGTCI